MAKGNPFLGKAAGKVGDIVLYVKNGKQVTRAAAAKVSNPNTVGQYTQRAIMATVQSAYKFGKAIFDHSFEGKKVGEENMNRFMKLNLNMLRRAVDHDLAIVRAGDELDTPTAFLAAKGATAFTPGTFIVSEGTFKAPFISIDAESKEFNFPAAIVADTKPSDYFVRNNINAGDISTVIIMAAGSPTSDDNTPDNPVMRAEFVFIRFIAKNVSSLSNWTNIKASDLFEIETNSFKAGLIDLIGVETFVNDGSKVVFDLNTCVSDSDMVLPCAAGVISSREDLKVRSNCQLQLLNQFGLTVEYYEPYWDGSRTLSPSDLILEGGGF